MKLLIGAALIFAGLVALGALFSMSLRRGIPNARTLVRTRHIARKRFMTPVELEMLKHLESAFPQYRVHAQVAMGALLRVTSGLDRRDWFAVRNLFSQKIIDYVLQDRVSGEVVALVELDDYTHDPIKDVVRDELTAAGGYKTIRFPATLRPELTSVGAIVSQGLACFEPQP